MGNVKYILCLALFFYVGNRYCLGQGVTNVQYNAIYSGVPWFDDHGNIVNAHGANIIKENGRFYLIGECHSDTNNAFTAFNCYSSADLYNWKFENQVLKIQQDGILGPNRVGERVKVMKCPLTGEFILFMHADNLGYKDPYIAYAISATITGDYTLMGPLLFNGKPIKKWDMGTFQDGDGSGYVLIHGGNIFKLANDYHSVTEQVLKDMTPESESPAVFKANNTYFWLASSRTSWERNDNFYFTANSLKGPWISRGYFAPDKKLTWDSQTTFVLPLPGIKKDTTYMFMGDRWSYPRQGSAATYVWQPLKVSESSIAIPQFIDAWKLNLSTAQWGTDKFENKAIVYAGKKQISYQGKWDGPGKNDAVEVMNVSAAEGAQMNINFTGSQIKLYGYNSLNGGYAKVDLLDKNKKIIATATIDFYSKNPNTGIKYVSPILVKSAYTLIIKVLGAHSQWSNKAHTIFGSTGDQVAITKVAIIN
ncbi:MAG: family 43 glycosylhydrolase [Mucilaginibacter sp.]|uniref:family 43 glycosylhydrolase n=1 Tax=Mucilaginibacter sp. TaxID=1882438 RepID=UPI00326519B8